MPKDDLRHYRFRGDDSRALAENAASESVRNIHLEMARRYDDLADQAQRAIAASEHGKGV